MIWFAILFGGFILFCLWALLHGPPIRDIKKPDAATVREVNASLKREGVDPKTAWKHGDDPGEEA